MSVIKQKYVGKHPVADLAEHPDNPRRGDDSAVAESIEDNGFYGAILVQESTKLVIAGNTRFRTMRDAGERTVPVIVLDVDDVQAKKIMLADNRTSDFAHYDDTALLALLTEVQGDQGNLAGTGYDSLAFEMLLSSQQQADMLGGVRQGMTPADRADSYADSDIRSIILPFGRDDYEEALAGLTALRSAHSLDTNSELILKLIREAQA